MARSKEFDKDTVLEKAMEVFRRKGFEATSIQDLVNAMGINRGSIYDTFGNKSKLFKLTLSRYQRVSPTQQLLNNSKTGGPRKEIETFFQNLAKLHSLPNKKCGCLITNSIAELAYRDEELAVHFKTHIKYVENALYTLIKRGQEAGDFNPWRDPRSLARLLLASAQGLILISKVDQEAETLIDIANASIALLD